MAKHNELGCDGEHYAANYLESLGYAILNRNWREGHLEIDIVARYADELVMVEVKTRSGNDFGNPEDAVDEKKIRSLVRAADCYINMFGIDLHTRFDIVTVIPGVEGVRIDHIIDAFCAPVE